MARPLRIAFAGACYHVTARGNERKAVFRDAVDRRRFLQRVSEVVGRYRLRLHAFVLMRNHYHLLVETPEAHLSRALRQLNGVYTQDFNRRHHRVGHHFQGRYRALLVENPGDGGDVANFRTSRRCPEEGSEVRSVAAHSRRGR